MLDNRQVQFQSYATGQWSVRQDASAASHIVAKAFAMARATNRAYGEVEAYLQREIDRVSSSDGCPPQSWSIYIEGDAQPGLRLDYGDTFVYTATAHYYGVAQSHGTRGG